MFWFKVNPSQLILHHLHCAKMTSVLNFVSSSEIDALSVLKVANGPHHDDDLSKGKINLKGKKPKFMTRYAFP